MPSARGNAGLVLRAAPAPLLPFRLKDVDNSDGKLYLVFEWVDKDLKKYMDSVSGGMTMPLVKVRRLPCPGEGGERMSSGASLDSFVLAVLPLPASPGHGLLPRARRHAP